MSLTKVTYAMIEGGAINPHDYGVIGDGTTDDAAAMQIAIDEAVANQLPLLLAPVTYNITANVLSATLAAGEKLIVIGNGATFNTTIADAANFYDGFFTIDGTSTSEVVINDFSITSDQAGAWSSARLRGKMVGLAIKTMANVNLINVKVTGFAFINIWLYYMNKGLVLDCEGTNSIYAGLFMQSCEDVNVYGGVYNQNGGDNAGTIEGYGVSAAGKFDVADRNNQRIKIDGVTAIDNIGKGIDAHNCLQFVVTNCHVRGYGRQGIYAVNEAGGSKNVSNVVVSNNNVSGSGGTPLATSANGIMVGSTEGGTVGSFVVSNNIVRSNTQSTVDGNGIFITNPDSGTLVGSVVVDGNTLDDAAEVTGSAIRINNNSVNWPFITVSNNVINQTVACANGILVEKSENAIVSNNIIQTTSTMVNGIVSGTLVSAAFNGNILEGTFSTSSISVLGAAYQIARGNLVNGTPFPDYANTGATVDFASAAPVSGSWFIGSVRWNIAPAIGQPIGWRCTVSGTPGTWVAMANL